MSNNKRNIATVMIVLLMGCKIVAADIIIDLGGILIKTKKMPVASKIGIFNLMGHTLTHRKSPRKDFYRFLENVKPITPLSDVKQVAYDDRGRKLPCIMCDWLKGVPSKKILHRIAKAHPSKFNWKLAQAVFDPETMSKSKRLMKNGVRFVQEYKAQGHNFYILANQDTETIEILKTQYPDFFKLFSGTVFSGTCGLIKPDPAIFNHILATYSLDPKNCFFIDDQIENIETAKKLGIATCNICSSKGSQNFKKIRTDINRWIKSIKPRNTMASRNTAIKNYFEIQ